MRQVLIILQDAVGGAERMSVLIGKSLVKAGFNVKFYLLESDVSSSIIDFIPMGLNVERIPFANPLNTTLAIVSKIMKERPNVVFSSVLNINNKILPFRCLFPRAKIIIRCDNYLYTYTKRQQKMVLSLYPLADIIIGQTEEMRDELLQLRKFRKDQVITLHNPIDYDTINVKLKAANNPFPQDGLKHFVSSGRFAYQKGFDLLIEAFFRYLEIQSDSDLYIIGDYEYENRTVFNQLKQIAQTKGISDRIHYLGYQSNPYPYIKYADCFVLSSRWEGLPNVLIEALFLGTPVASFRCIPIVERIIEEGITGFTAESGDVSSLALAMSKAINLGRVKSSYKSSSIADFIKLF